MLILGDPKVPAHLLVFAVQTALTTSTCIADYLSWSDYTNAEKIELGKLYVPYLALCKLSPFFHLGSRTQDFELALGGKRKSCSLQATICFSLRESELAKC